MADLRDEMDATDEEKRPINNASSAERGEHCEDIPPPPPEVKVRRHGRQGCFFTRGQACALALTIFLLLLVVGAVVAILTRTHLCDCHDGYRVGMWNSGLMPPKETVPSGYPWSGIRLARTLIPSRYRLELKVDLTSFTFSGTVEINVTCRRSTEYVILHVNGLKIDKSKVTITEVESGEQVGISRHVKVPINQFWVLQAEKDLRKGKHYRIRFGHFEGQLLDDLRGLYRSSYKDDHDVTR